MGRDNWCSIHDCTMDVCFFIHNPEAQREPQDVDELDVQIVYRDSEGPELVPLPCGHTVDNFPGEQARLACPSPSCYKEYKLERKGSAGIHITEV